jgi:hypothetical protein
MALGPIRYPDDRPNRLTQTEDVMHIPYGSHDRGFHAKPDRKPFMTLVKEAITHSVFGGLCPHKAASARFCDEFGHRVGPERAQRRTLELESGRKYVAVLFSDLSGYMPCPKI